MCDTLKNPSVHSTRHRVYVQNVPVCTTCARGAGIHGDVLNVHMGTCGVDTRGEAKRWEGSSSASFFIGKTSVFTIEHLNWMLGSSLIANFLLTKICPHMGYHVLQRFIHQRNPWILHLLRMGRAQTLNAPLLPVAMYSPYETGTHLQTRTTTRRNGDNKTRTRHQQDDRDTRRRRDGKVHHRTTKRQEHNSKRRHHHTTPTHPNQPTTTRDTRHDSAPQHAHYMYMYVYVYMYMSVFMYMSVSPKPLTFPQWLKVHSLVTKCGRGKTVNQKLQPFNCLKKK